MEKLKQEDFVTLDFLVGILDTSESTVRRDLDELANEKNSTVFTEVLKEIVR
ncbi:transcriptional regulator, DeoR family [Streptococcus macacae NCTC 11558]|uniref:Transcriptional regulator, DeoR family n=1 Tax=Streptococcus macacae NCTC 11558 TaxID=764298 RepID=G5JTZ2_9STRE|nr:transcriptional regulator, DeoR family [Streptococcus macacae NCTC 11558]